MVGANRGRLTRRQEAQAIGDLLTLLTRRQRERYRRRARGRLIGYKKLRPELRLYD